MLQCSRDTQNNIKLESYLEVILLSRWTNMKNSRNSKHTQAITHVYAICTSQTKLPEISYTDTWLYISNLLPY